MSSGMTDFSLCIIAIVHQRAEEESASKVETSFRGDMWQKNSSKSEKEDLQGGSEISYVIWFGDKPHSKKSTKGLLWLLRYKSARLP